MRALVSAAALLTCSALATLVCTHQASPPGTELRRNPAMRQSVKRIPIEIPITNQLYVRARVNNSEPMWFFIDTGSTWTFLDENTAKELNITAEGNRTLETGQANSLRMAFAKDTSLEISGVKVPLKELAVASIKFKHAPQIVGIIGSDLFKRFVVEIDYVAKTIELFEPKDYQYKGRGEILPMEIMEEIPHVTVNISRGNVTSLPAKLLVDTGAAQTIALYAPFVEKHKLLETLEGTIQVAAGGLGGRQSHA